MFDLKILKETCCPKCCPRQMPIPVKNSSCKVQINIGLCKSIKDKKEPPKVIPPKMKVASLAVLQFSIALFYELLDQVSHAG